MLSEAQIEKWAAKNKQLQEIFADVSKSNPEMIELTSVIVPKLLEEAKARRVDNAYETALRRIVKKIKDIEVSGCPDYSGVGRELFKILVEIRRTGEGALR